jgi:hypothetical protein
LRAAEDVGIRNAEDAEDAEDGECAGDAADDGVMRVRRMNSPEGTPWVLIS